MGRELKEFIPFNAAIILPKKPSSELHRDGDRDVHTRTLGTAAVGGFPPPGRVMLGASQIHPNPIF